MSVVKGAFQSAFCGATLCWLNQCSQKLPYEVRPLRRQLGHSRRTQISPVRLDGSAIRDSSGHDEIADSREQVDMAMTYAVLADVAASVTDLKKDPMGTIREGGGETVVILNRNEPAFYAVPPARYEAMLELIDDLRLAEIVRARRGEPTVQVDIDDLIAEAGGAGKD